MKDDDSLPTTTALSVKKETSDSVLFGKGRYKFWALAAILLLAFWSMLTGTVTLRWSAGNLNSLVDDIDSPIRDDLDVLEMEDREKVVKHMWDIYTNSRRIRLPKFWQEAFEAAYEELTSDASDVKEAAIAEIAKMSIRSIDLDPLPVQSTVHGYACAVWVEVLNCDYRRPGVGINLLFCPLLCLSSLLTNPDFRDISLLSQIRARELSKSLKLAAVASKGSGH
ncbi:hypothetical protein POTOM_028006 [Populus tomentosa]|uniref:Uncharacterized protein n=1 Tax=Populus tomentosa TaxID=118781 RepID=A0A8X7ZCM0_POPTO|nr:hypothetical protein POTOM_028006 [Populus tomentosa]